MDIIGIIANNIIVSFCLFICIGYIIYYKTINYGLVVDDIARYDENKKENNTKRTTTSRYNKTLLKLMKKYKIFNNVKLDHFITLTIHIITSFTIYLVFGCNNISLMAGLLFLLNPANHQCSIWISGRHYMNSTMLALIMYAFPLSSLIFYPYVLTINLTLLLFPFMFIVSNPILFLLFPLYLMYYKYKRRIKFNFKDISKQPLGLDVLEEKYNGYTPIMKEISFRKLIIVIKTYSYYFMHNWLPFKCGMYPEYLLNFGITPKGTKKGFSLDKDFWFGIALIITNLTLVVLNIHPLITLGIIWYSLFIAQFCNIITISQNIVDRYSYLPNVGSMIILAGLINIINQPIVFVVFIVFFITKLFEVMPQYETYDKWLRYHTHIFPKSPYCYIFLSNKELIQKCFYRSAVFCEEGLVGNPDCYKLLYNLGVSYMCMGNAKLALEVFETAQKNLVLGTEETSGKNIKALIENTKYAIAHPDKKMHFNFKVVE